MVDERRWQVGICGTFDVANYGDLLYPLIAESELAERLGPVILHRFSYHEKSPPEWPYHVTSLAALPDMVRDFDGLLLGGGFLIRFDKQVAPGYAPPVAGIHHPTGYWLTPALIALQNDVPVVWNAPGMHCNAIPKWANPLLSLTTTLSRYVSVRDHCSRAALQPLSVAPVTVVPDTAFQLPRLLNLEGPSSAEFTRLATAARLIRPYVVVQATLGLDFIRFIRSSNEQLRDLQFLALPIGPALGERHEIIDPDVPGVVHLTEWPSPLGIAEFIARSEAVVGHSYHLLITALSFGVPAFTRQDLSVGKYTALQRFDSIFVLPQNGVPDPDWFIKRVGRSEPSALLRGTCNALGQHWDRIATELQAGSTTTSTALNRFWQSLPGALEDAQSRLDEAGIDLEKELLETESLREVLAAMRAEAARDQAPLEERVAAARAERDETVRQLEESLASARADGVEAHLRLNRMLATNRAESAKTQARLEESLNTTRAEAAETQQRLEEALQLLTIARHERTDTKRQLEEALAQAASARDEVQELNGRIKEMVGTLTEARAEKKAAEVRTAAIIRSPSWKAALRSLGRKLWKQQKGRVIKLDQLRHHQLETDPYQWAAVTDLFDPGDAARLAATYPCDHFKLIAASGGEKDYEYEARSLIGMCAQVITHPEELSDVWRALARDLLSSEYRMAMANFTGCDLSQAPMEVNVFHYGPGGSLGAHCDLAEKIVTHVLYFNRTWNRADGGCLSILRSANPADLAAVIPPIVGYSSIIVRSENSWHAVSRLADRAPVSRRSVTVTFYRPGSVSSMWPPGDGTPLHRYHAADLT